MRTALLQPPPASPAGAVRLRLSPDVRIPQILDAALVEFAERGFAATRMDDIARRSGLSKGGLYAHFGSKDAVFEALLQRSLTPPDLGEMSLPQPAGPAQFAQWLVDRLYAALAQPMAVATLRLLIAESERVPRLVEAWQRQVAQPYLVLLGQVLRRHAGPGASDLLVREPWLAVAPVVHAVVAQLVFGGGLPELQRHRQAHAEMLAELLGAGRDAA